jgi:hypothetical protein
MKLCQTERRVDDYLLDRMDEAERNAFEEHLFNCPSCFAKVSEKAEFLAVIKARGETLFGDLERTGPEKTGPAARFLAMLSPRQWAATAVTAAMILAAVILFLPGNRDAGFPELPIVGDTVRGGSVTLISPLGDIPEAPKELRWESAGEGVEYQYRIAIESGERLWSATTSETSISLPEDVKSGMTAGIEYSWQVKAFSPQGALTAASNLMRFRITR